MVQRFISLFEDKQVQFLIRCGVPEDVAQKCFDTAGKKWAAHLAVLSFQSLNGPKLKWEGNFPEWPRPLSTAMVQHWHDELVEFSWSYLSRIVETVDKPRLPEVFVDLKQVTTYKVADMIGELNLIHDWKIGATEGRGGLERESINLQTMEWNDALASAQTWHRRIEASGSGKYLDTKEGQTVITKFEDGLYWLNLNTSSCKDEANSMGHCGNGQYNLFSLREPLTKQLIGKKGRPLVTSDVDVNGHVAHQTSAAGNKLPDQKYWTQILDLWGALEVRYVINETPYGAGLSYDRLESEHIEYYKEKFGIYLESYTQEYKYEEDDLRRLREDLQTFNNENADFVHVSYYLEVRDYMEYTQEQAEFYITVYLPKEAGSIQGFSVADLEAGIEECFDYWGSDDFVENKGFSSNDEDSFTFDFYFVPHETDAGCGIAADTAVLDMLEHFKSEFYQIFANSIREGDGVITKTMDKLKNLRDPESAFDIMIDKETWGSAGGSPSPDIVLIVDAQELYLQGDGLEDDLSKHFPEYRLNSPDNDQFAPVVREKSKLSGEDLLLFRLNGAIDDEAIAKLLKLIELSEE